MQKDSELSSMFLLSVNLSGLDQHVDMITIRSCAILGTFNKITNLSGSSVFSVVFQQLNFFQMKLATLEKVRVFI